MALTLTPDSDGMDMAVVATASLRRMSLNMAGAFALTETMRYDRGACLWRGAPHPDYNSENDDWL